MPQQSAQTHCFHCGRPPSPPAGLLSSLTSTFTDLGLDVVKADIGGKDGSFKDTFWVTAEGGGKVSAQDIPAMSAALEALLASYTKSSSSVRPKLSVPGASEDRQELLHTLMDTYVKNDVLSIQQSIVNREWWLRGAGGWGGAVKYFLCHSCLSSN